jgi:hypothetical protein
MPRIKIRFILESSNKKQVPWRNNTMPSKKLVTPARDGRQAKEPKSSVLC